jgi:phosphatidylglycerol---prolipoprotein diacylglyceryl transferase
MPKEPRQGPTVSGRVHQRIVHGQAGRSSYPPSTILKYQPINEIDTHAIRLLSGLSVLLACSSMHPVLFHFGRFVVPTYGVLAALGLMAALALSLRTANLAGIDPDDLWDAGVFLVLSALVISRLLLVITNFKSFLSYPIVVLTLPSLTATTIVLTLIATSLYLYLKHLPILSTLDAWSASATLAWAFLALGHLAEGSDPGLPTNVPWKIPSPTGGAYLHPVALYTALAALAISIVTLRYLHSDPQPGRTAALALSASGLAQFLITFLRHPTQALDASNTFINILDPIQWVSLAMLAAAGILFLQSQPQTERHAL